MGSMKTGVILCLDLTPLKEKISQLVLELELAFPESIPDDIRSRFLGLSNDIFLGELTSAVTADRTLQVVQRIDLGCGFDDLTAAVRANDRNL